VLAALHSLRVFQAAISDESFILYRYARHLSVGHGLVWNVGERPIEGFTSLLHVILLALGSVLGFDIVLIGQILGVAGAMLVCVAAACLGREIGGGDRRVGIVSALIVALASPLAAWARGGLETTAFTGLLAFAMAAWLTESRNRDSRLGTAVLFFLATLSRPEALGVAMMTIVFDVLDSHDRDRRTPLRRMAAWWPYGVCLVGLAIWKAIYFGGVVPNTYYAKAGGGLPALKAGTLYVIDFFRAYGGLNVLLAVVPLLLLPRTCSRKVLYVSTCVIAYCLHVARIGGDYQYFSRYLVPTLPLLAALTAYGAMRAWDATRDQPFRRRGAAALLVAASATLQLALPSIRELRDRPWLLFRPMRLVNDTDPGVFTRDFEYMGKALRDVTLPHQTIAAVAVGAIGYYSERPIVDLLGLNDRIIARLPVHPQPRPWVSGHMKGSASETIRRQPDFIVLPVRPTESPYASPSAKEQKAYPFVAELLQNSEFREEYVLEVHRLPDGRWLNVYRRRDSSRGSTPAVTSE
jgi:hypothetical protein